MGFIFLAGIVHHMRRSMFVLLMLSLAAFAALDQSYSQVVSRNGTSTITRTSDITIFAGQLTVQALEKMAAACEESDSLDCSVDIGEKKVTFRESFAPGGYYSMSSDYGFPFITHTLTIDRIPTDRFSSSLDKLLRASGVAGEQGASIRPIELADKKTAQENAQILRSVNANITYTILMPIAVSEARAGNVSGSVEGAGVAFDLVEVIGAGEPIVVVGRELNLGYMVAAAGVIVLAALALSFFGTKKPRRKKK